MLIDEEDTKDIDEIVVQGKSQKRLWELAKEVFQH